jgi:nucleoside-diphosphate-sugar epimerase
MKLLLIGGTRFIGRTVVQKALELGHEVAIFHRGQHETDFAAEVTHIHGENIDIADHLEEIKTYNPDAAIDTTQFETESTQTVVDALTGVVDRYVLVSSMDVYVAYVRLHRTELGPPQPLPITEEGELRTLPGEGLTEEIDNLNAERVVLGQQDLPATITRLPAVFGPGDYQRRIGEMIDKLKASDGELKLHPIQANFRWTWGYVENIADMLLESVGDRRSGNRVYSLGYPAGVSVLELYEMVADVIEWGGSVVVTEDGTEEPEQDLTQHWIADSTKFRRDFDYSERISLEKAITLTVQHDLAAQA